MTTNLGVRGSPVTARLNERCADGETKIWETETYPRNILIRRGWSSVMFMEGF
jgi:hypothetical protein